MADTGKNSRNNHTASLGKLFCEKSCGATLEANTKRTEGKKKMQNGLICALQRSRLWEAKHNSLKMEAAYWSLFLFWAFLKSWALLALWPTCLRLITPWAFSNNLLVKFGPLAWFYLQSKWNQIKTKYFQTKIFAIKIIELFN